MMSDISTCSQKEANGYTKLVFKTLGMLTTLRRARIQSTHFCKQSSLGWSWGHLSPSTIYPPDTRFSIVSSPTTLEVSKPEVLIHTFHSPSPRPITLHSIDILMIPLYIVDQNTHAIVMRRERKVPIKRDIRRQSMNMLIHMNNRRGYQWE
jgi:hypothetical protein